tara:strand:- start:741 stop:914 length:174 start_codon:yes stop_codon:yes gene_type:complete
LSGAGWSQARSIRLRRLAQGRRAHRQQGRKSLRDKLGGTSDAPGMASAESIRKEAAE